MNPLRDDLPRCARRRQGFPSLGPAAALPSAVNLPYPIMRFFETLGMADDIPWRPTHDEDEPPF
jgi:hypothetical protein